MRKSSILIYRNTVIVVAISLLVLLGGCYSPLQDDASGFLLSFGFLSTQDVPAASDGWVIDVYIYSAADVSIDAQNLESVQFKSDASPVPISGKPFHRVEIGDANWVDLGWGDGNRMAQIGSVPVGGPYVLFVQVWNSGNLSDEYVSGTSDQGYKLVTFSIIPGKNTALSHDDILSVGAH